MVPVTVHGVEYPSIRAAARANGVSDSAITAARIKGTLHRVGSGRTGVEPMQVMIGGVVYQDAKTAAQALGVAIATVYDAIRLGDPDRIVRPRTYNPSTSHPITIGPLKFRSKREAARQLGFKNPEYVSKVIRSGSRRGWQKILSAAMKEADRRGPARRVY